MLRRWRGRSLRSYETRIEVTIIYVCAAEHSSFVHDDDEAAGDELLARSVYRDTADLVP